MAKPSPGRKWQRTMRAAVREACETWWIQRAGPVTPKQFEEIINRATLPILGTLQNEPLEVLRALVPSLVRLMRQRPSSRGDGRGAA